MSGWDHFGFQWFKAFYKHWKRFINFCKRTLRRNRDPRLLIAAYRGYARPDYLFLMGRVLRDKNILTSNMDSKWRNLINAYRRFGSNEIRNAHLRIQFGDNTFEVTSDKEGYFKIDAPLPLWVEASRVTWMPARIDLLKIPRFQTIELSASVQVFMPDLHAPFGVVSDIDDTLLHTYLTSPLKWRAAYQTFFHNARTRRMVAGAAHFLSALARSNSANGRIPFFYVSNSPWNLYDLLRDFLIDKGFPQGPLLLRDWSSPWKKRPSKSSRGHKFEHIANILENFPQMSFVLIGDSGEKDALIYQSISRHFPGRIKAIFIREIRHERKKRITPAAGLSPIHRIRDFQQAVIIAYEMGLLNKSELNREITD